MKPVDKICKHHTVTTCIHELSLCIREMSSPKEIVQFSVQEFMPKLGLDDFVIYRVCDRTNRLIKYASLDQVEMNSLGSTSAFSLKFGQGIVGNAAVCKHTIIVPDTEKNEHYFQDGKKRYSELATPIIFKNRLLGVMDSEHKEKHFYKTYHVRLFEILSTLLAPYLNELQPSKKLQHHLMDFHQLLKHEQLYLNEELNLNEVSRLLEISPQYLSQAIHKYSTDGFNKIVNMYRVKHFMNTIKNNEYKERSILDLAYASGFASKSTFNRAFKAFTGSTPSAYLRMMRHS